MEFIGDFARRIRAKKQETKIETPQLRFELNLEVQEGDYAEFSYKELVKKATISHDAITSPVEDEQASPSLSFMKDLLDRGAGYDENDSFIDNDEPYDEFLPPTVSTEFGGFYVNCGRLKFKKTSKSGRHAEAQPKKKQPATNRIPHNRKRPSLKPISKLVKTKKARVTMEHKQLNKSQKTVPQNKRNNTSSVTKTCDEEPGANVNPTVRSSTTTSDTDSTSDEIQIVGMFDKNGVSIKSGGSSNPESTVPNPVAEEHRKNHASNSPEGKDATRKQDGAKKRVMTDHIYACSAGKADAKDENIYGTDKSPYGSTSGKINSGAVSQAGKTMESTDDEAMQSHADNSESDVDNILQPSVMPLDLPPPLKLMLESFAQLARQINQRKDGQAFLNRNSTKKMLLKIHDFCETVPRAQRSSVFQFMASLLHIMPRSLRIRIKKLKKKQNEDKLLNSLSELREEIGNIVCKKEQPKNVFGASAENVHSSAPRDVSQALSFEWNKTLVKKLRNVLEAKLHLLKESGARNSAITESMKEFVESDVLKLWPPGTIDPAIVHKKVQLFLLSREK